MGNRSWLYLEHRTAADDEEAASTEFGAANNNFPVLWQILLADGAAGAAIDHQRVFGDAGTRNLASDAHAALDRVRRMQAFVGQHPMLHTLPQVALQFEALALHLAALIDEAPEGTRACLSADLDELSWMDGDAQQDGFIERSRNECNARWARVQRCIDGGNHPGFDAELGIKRFADWEGWAWQFGLGGVSHAYFNGYEPPRDERFEDFMANEGDGDEQDGEAGEDRDWDNHLGGPLWRFEANGLWGVRFSEDGERRTVAEPAWDDIRTSGASDARLLWVSRGEHTGLLLAHTDAPRVLLEPQLDEAWDFEDDIATVLVGDHIGLLRPDGSWLMAPSVDEIWSFAGGMARARVGERQGYVDAQGRWAVAPQFDEAEDFAPCGLAPAHTDAGWGLVRTDGAWAVPPGFDTLEWHHDWGAFEATRGGKTGLIDAQGRVAVEPVYEVLELLEEYPVEMLQAADAAPGQSAPVARPKRFAVQREPGRCGLIDARGQVLVPFDYGLFESLEPLTGEERAHAMVQRDLVRVASKGGRTAKNAPWLRGIYDIGAGRELVPCRHRTVQPLTWGTQDIGWLVADPLPRAEKTDKTAKGQLAVGVLRADGSTLHPQAYPWIASPVSVSEGWYAVLVRSELRKRWSAGEPVKAARNDRDVYVWLHADGREQDHAAHMAARHAAGDLRAAYELACHLRDGEGVPADAMQALQWMARAAGVHAPGDAPASASPGGLPEAMRELALMLRTDAAGRGADLAGARAWLVHAVAHGGADDAETRAQLGYMLFEGLGGERDPEAGVRHYEAAAERDNPMALFNLGLALRAGEQVAPDLARAADYFRRSDEAGDHDGTLQLGVTLCRQAVQAGEKDGDGAADAAQAKVLYAEAAYAFQKLAEDDDSRLQGWGCYELGMLRFHGHGAPPDAVEAAEAAEAERWLLAGAALGDCEQNLESQRACVEDLAQVLYGDRESPLFDAHKAAEWAQRLQALPEAAPGD